MYCRAVINCQASVPAALNKIEECLANCMEAHSIPYRMDAVPETLWLLFKFSKQVVGNAQLYLKRFEVSSYRGRSHVAVHCRRNDMCVLLKRKIGYGGLQRLDDEM